MPDIEVRDLPDGVADAETSARAAEAFDAHLATKAAPAATDTPPAGDAAPAQQQAPDPLDEIASLSTAAPADGEEGNQDETKPGETKTDEEQPPKHLNPAQAANWKALRSEVKAATTKAATLEAQVAELEAKLAAKADPEELTKARKTIEDLEDRLAFFAIEQSPTFRAEFDDKIKADEETVWESLKAAGVNEAQLTRYREANAIKTQPLAFWDKVSSQLKGTPQLEAKALKIEAAVRNAKRLIAEREEALKDPEKLKAHGSKAAVAAAAQAKADEEFLTNFVAEAQKAHPWAKPVEVKPNATPAEKEAAKIHNERHEKYVAIFTKAIESNDIRDRAKIGLIAVQAYEFKAENARLEAALAQKEKELAAIKNASPKTVKDSVAPSTKPAGIKSPALPELELGGTMEDLERRLDQVLAKRRS